MFRHLHGAGESLRPRAEIDQQVRAVARRQRIAAREAALDAGGGCRQCGEDGAPRVPAATLALFDWVRRRACTRARGGSGSRAGALHC